MGSIARMDLKLPSKFRDVSWPFPTTPNSKTCFPINVWRGLVKEGHYSRQSKPLLVVGV